MQSVSANRQNKGKLVRWRSLLASFKLKFYSIQRLWRSKKCQPIRYNLKGDNLCLSKGAKIQICRASGEIAPCEISLKAFHLLQKRSEIDNTMYDCQSDGRVAIFVDRSAKKHSSRTERCVLAPCQISSISV